MTDDINEYLDEREKAYQEAAEGEPAPVLDPDDNAWHLQPTRRRLTEHFMQVWDICQRLGLHIIGGYARYLASPNEGQVIPGDIDVFIGECDRIADEQITFGRATEAFLEIFDDMKKNPLSNYFFMAERNDPEQVSVNLIIPRRDEMMVTVGTVYEILEMFDFTVVRAAVKDPYTIIVDPDFMKDEKAKQLNWRHINCPLAAIFRLVKYSRKGYFARPAEVVKLFLDWENRDEEYKQRLLELLDNTDLSEEEIMTLERLLWVD